MEVKTEFLVGNFNWNVPEARKVFELARDAGRLEELQEQIEGHFHGKTPTQDAVNLYVFSERKKILESIGLDEDGNDITKKRITVFYRVTGVCSEEVEAETPHEARQKILDEFEKPDGDPLVSFMRDDVESVVPVCYDDWHGNTRDFGPSEESKRALMYALTGETVWILSKFELENGVTSGMPVVSIFVSGSDAKTAMTKAFDREFSKGRPAKYKSPRGGAETCFLRRDDGTGSTWYLSKVFFR